MTFLWSQLLWLLLLVPLMIGTYILILKRKKRMALRYANLAVVKSAIGKGPGWRRHVPPVLFLLGMTMLILAVARPAAVVTLASSRGTIVLALDVSGSMRATDISPSRLQAAQIAAKEFISSQPADVQIGIVAFASAALLVQVPTIDREALHAAIDRFQLRRGTAVGAGVIASLATIFPDQKFDTTETTDQFGAFSFPTGGQVFTDRLRGLESRSLEELRSPDEETEHVPVEPGSYQSAVVILLTDGATTTGPDPVESGKLAADYGVRIYTVGFGSKEGQVIRFGGRSMRAQLDDVTLKQIADTTKGEYFEAQSSEDLQKVYSLLSTRLINEKKLTEIAFLFAGIAAVFIGLGAGLSMLWFGRIA